MVAAVRGETTKDLSENACTVYAYRLQGFLADTLVLNKLVETTSGTLIPVADGEEATLQKAARAVSERPWRIAKITADGATDLMLGSGSTTVHAGQRLMITGRGNPTAPITLTLTRGDQTQSVQVQSEQAIASPLAARTFGEVAVGRFESLGEQSAELAVAYARNFRVPGRTCSLVMLETDADYQRYGIKDDDDALVVRTTDVGAETERILADQGEERANSKAMFIRWIERLQDAPQPLLTMPTALSMYLRQQHDDAFEIALQRLQTKVTSRDEINAAYAEMLKGESLDASVLYSEAERRLVKYSAADAIKVLSTLLEERPGDIDVNRSLAFAALQWQRPDQAAALFQRVLFARPYQPQTLLLLAQCYAELGQEAAAVACYELVLHGTWHDRWRSVIQVAEFEEHALLRRLVAANAIESLPGRAFLTARLEQLNAKLGDRANDLAVVMYWNTDRTDVDLHVTDPSGEECFYSHPQTVAGGALPFDITQGLGPELFTQAKTPAGNYQIKAKYYRSDNMRLGAPTMLYTRVYQPAAKSSLDVTSKLLLLSTASEEIAIATINRSGE